jgi:hypothetical protein
VRAVGPVLDYEADRRAEALVHQLERRVSAERAALERVPKSMPVPRDVLALLATAPHELDGVELPPHYRPRIVALHAEVQAMIDDLALRQTELGGRIATVRSARQAGPSACLVDCSA